MVLKNSANRIRIGEYEYYLDMVIAIGNAGPVIDVSVSDISDVVLPSMTSVSFKDSGDIIFIKHLGKYHVVCGLKHLGNISKDQIVHGHLISKVALKKARIVTF